MPTPKTQMRGADLVTHTLAAADRKTIFTLSGNHIMALFDASIEPGLDLVHVRHEAAAVHMADAVGRLSGEVGVAWVTGGQGHSNAVAGLTTAMCADTPMVLLSGHAGTNERGRGAFQEMDQADLARPVTKASWTATSAAHLGHDLAKAIRIAKSGRPGPVHLSLPVDLLEAKVETDQGAVPGAAAFARCVTSMSSKTAATIVTLMGQAKRPLILAGPVLCTPAGRASLRALEVASGIPTIGMESPRGINDPSLGAFAEVLAEADLIVLLGKLHDFTLRFAEPPHVRADAEFIAIDPDARMLARVVGEKGARVLSTSIADADAAASALITAASEPCGDAGWQRHVHDAISYRPPGWTQAHPTSAPLSSPSLCRALQPLFDADPDAIFVADGGEIGQWAQACVTANRRIINGVAGSIGAALPFAIAARTLERRAPIIAVMGDGTFGFHMAEFDTAVRHGLPFVAVVGNDARWNAEHQIQLREYGAGRAHGCSLLPTRYDQVAIALGGHGELISRHEDLGAALARAVASGKPACVNVIIDGQPAPVMRRKSSV